MPIQLNAMLMRLVYKVLMETLSYRIWRDLIYIVLLGSTTPQQFSSSVHQIHFIFPVYWQATFMVIKQDAAAQKIPYERKKFQHAITIFTITKSVDL